MPEMTFASLAALAVSMVTAVFTSIVATLKASWEASHKWFAVGCGIFAVLVYFGYLHFKIPADTPELSRQVADLSAKLDRLTPAKPECPAVVPMKKAKK